MARRNRVRTVYRRAKARVRRVVARAAPSRKSSKGGSMSPDSLFRGVAVAQGGLILLESPISAVIGNDDLKAGIRNGLSNLRQIPLGDYFKAMGPSIVVEGAIGTRKVVKKATTRAFGLFK